MSLPPKRRFLSPLLNEDIESLAARALPDEDGVSAVDKLKSWNLHIFAVRKPPEVLGSDVLFIEPPLRASGFGLLGATVRKATAQSPAPRAE